VDDGVVASQDLPLVSVVIPVYNGAAYLAQAIESVRAQRYPRYEILVIDNGSEDATREVARRFPDVRYHALPLTGDTALARNQGVELAEGDYIAFLDQDDVWTAGKLHAQIAFLLAHPTYAGVVGYQQMVLEPGHAKPHWLKQQFLEAPQMGYLPSALLVRRSAFADISLFDPSFPLASDVAWFFRAKHRNLPIHMLDQVVVERRIHNDNASHRCAQIHKELLAVIRSSLTERRGGVVSVILPVWNGENYLKEAVESILAQDYPRLEIVIVDDGSTDGTAPLIRSFGSKVRPLFLPENRGLGASRNAGIRIASGDYFAFLDHDDLWSPAKLSSQLRLLQERPDDPLVFCQAQQFLCPTLSDSERAELIVDESATTAYFAGTLLLSRKRLFEVGLFLEEKVLGEFVDWYLRALEKKVPIALLQEVGLYRRVHRHNMGRQKEHYHRTDYLKILKASLDRRRAAAEPRSV
jgi:glycosyltransferase involved in cell wall biosynthesis